MTKAKATIEVPIQNPTKKLFVICDDRTFNLTLPEGVKITYGPWAPPQTGKMLGGYHGEPSKARGTLRVYQGSKENIIALFTGVVSFRQSDLVIEEEFPLVETTITAMDSPYTPGYGLSNIKNPW